MIRRVFDAALLNKVANHPDVFKWIAAPGVLAFDFTSVAADPDNVVLMADCGGFVCIPKGSGQYEVHTQFLPQAANSVVAAARDGIAYMFTATDCTELVTYVPHGNRRAKRLTQAMGFAVTATDGSWTYPDGECVGMDSYRLTKGEWQCRQQQ